MLRPARGALHHPIHVLIAGRGNVQLMNLADGRSGPGVSPFVDFGVAIGKREPRCAIVIRSRKIAPDVSDSTADGHDHIAIIHGIGVLIHEQPGHYRLAKISHLEKIRLSLDVLHLHQVREQRRQEHLVGTARNAAR